MRKNIEIFKELDTKPVFIVPHEKVRVGSWKELAGDSITVLADSGFYVSMVYGVAFQMRIHSDTSNTPGTFIIGKDGLLKWAKIGEGRNNFHDRPSYQEIADRIKQTEN